MKVLLHVVVVMAAAGSCGGYRLFFLWSPPVPQRAVSRQTILKNSGPSCMDLQPQGPAPAPCYAHGLVQGCPSHVLGFCLCFRG